MTDKIEKKIPTEIYSRVVGYFRPVSQWNKGKKSEFVDRKHYKLPKLENDHRRKI